VNGSNFLSSDLNQEGEAATRSGCLSFLLFPPFATILFGALLFFGLTRISLPLPAQAESVFIDELSGIFTSQVLRWDSQIVTWARENKLDPNLVATVMQIESCGDPNAISGAGAMGLFQVMPYHFAESEYPFSPNTNALRGLNYLHSSLQTYSGNIALALAGYNGGINGAARPRSEWAQETIDYIYWGENIYADAASGRESSPTLEEWLAAGGASLCAQAEQQLAATR
jgi:hypothetical protein